MVQGWQSIAGVSAFGSLVIGSWIRDRKRSKAMAALAGRLGLHLWGERLPPELSLSGTPFAKASGIWNVMEGELHGISVVAFDCRVGTGKGQWRRTVIAVRNLGEILGTPLEDVHIIKRVGEWDFLYAPYKILVLRRGLMPVSELDERLSALRKE